LISRSLAGSAGLATGSPDGRHGNDRLLLGLHSVLCESLTFWRHQPSRSKPNGQPLESSQLGGLRSQAGAPGVLALSTIGYGFAAAPRLAIIPRNPLPISDSAPIYARCGGCGTDAVSGMRIFAPEFSLHRRGECPGPRSECVDLVWFPPAGETSLLSRFLGSSVAMTFLFAALVGSTPLVLAYFFSKGWAALRLGLRAKARNLTRGRSNSQIKPAPPIKSPARESPLCLPGP
jgi:hypothetical protein